MDFYTLQKTYAEKEFESDMRFGLNEKTVVKNANLYGKNLLKAKKEKSLLSRILEALCEPMMLILIFSLLITFGTNLGRFLKGGEADFIECIGILIAVCLSVVITLVMEGSSKRAFNALNKLYENVSVQVVRKGSVVVLPQEEVVCGDLILLGAGDKIVADGRIVDSSDLKIDESALTGESLPVKKDANAILSGDTHLADRVNMAYSGTFVTGGNGKMIVTAVGDNAEIGKIATELRSKKDAPSPLKQKLDKLSKRVTIIGGVSALLVFILNIVRLALAKNLSFFTVQDAFISSVILIVAAVPEGLPTIVAVSLALNMIKLAGENALIRKMIATETSGAVSVICSDKTGTLTENKMSVKELVLSDFSSLLPKDITATLYENFCLNSTAEVIVKNKVTAYLGSSTEGALLAYYEKTVKEKYSVMRKAIAVDYREPFSSDKKYMVTGIKKGERVRLLIKGAPEVVLEFTTLTLSQKQKIKSEMANYERKAMRIICFAHKDCANIENTSSGYCYDGFAVICDPVRKEVYQAVRRCKQAHIKVKMLTGDNLLTATAIAKELNLISSESECVTATELEKLSEEQLIEKLKSVSVIARSTPITKLKVVKALKRAGEVVAVTGDGINDAPAIKQADVGFAMGITGSEITKEASDVILLNDSFSTVVKAIEFGRSVYRNLQRFILFQLTVNLSAVMLIMISLLLGFSAPFNTLQLLWINIIMDGPPALTLGLERSSSSLMKNKPVGRNESIITAKMLLRIIFNSLTIAFIVTAQRKFNFLGVPPESQNAVIFTCFILLQLFNAFNCREMGKKSIFSSITKNKIMLITFGVVFVVQVIIVQFGYGVFGISPLDIVTWVKVVAISSSVVAFTETVKLFYRVITKNHYKKANKKLSLSID